MHREQAWADFLEAKGLRKRGAAADSAVAAELERRGAPADVARQAAKRGLDSRFRENKRDPAAAAKGLDKNISVRELLYGLGVDVKDLR